MNNILIDGNNHVARAYHKAPDLHRKDGVSTGVVFVSLKMLKHTLENLEADFVYMCWDKGRSAERMKVYPEYKADRDRHRETEEGKSSYEEYKAQVSAFKEYVSLLPITQLEYPGVEADDIIGFLCRLNIEKSCADSIIIVSTDKTFWQFVPYGVRVYDPIKNIFISEEYIRERCGVPAENFIYYKAAIAESSDNVSGIKGFGSSAAQEILQDKVNTLNDLKERAVLLNKKKKFRDFVENFDIFERNYKLMNLMDIDEHVLQEHRQSIIKNYMNPNIKLDHIEIFKKAYIDEFSSIYMNRNEFLKPFQRLIP